ncbi:MAG TPA: gamma-glutamyltransferase [Anaeromyxobacteraceae bacterium]|nr:gamma-glutamyltransferase [Anaeromyxobacteraceae bacterium]
MLALLAVVLGATAVSPAGAVATAHPLASEAAAAVLRAGGNAADAAVAAAFALSVVEPQSSGLGGGGFALVHVAREGKVHAIDFREVAPAAAAPDMFAGGAPRRSLDGGLAIAVPGAVAGYAEVARRFGTRPLRELVEPAARLAERGFPVNAHYAAMARERLTCLAERPAAARELLRRGPDGRPAAPEPGWRLVRPDLARTLRLVGRDPAALQRGALAERIARAVREDGGMLTVEDLARYRVRERVPLEGRYRGHRLVSMPLPSAGGAIVIALLQALEPEDPRAGGYRPERFLHAMVEIEKRLFARRVLLGDPDRVPGAAIAMEEMVSPAFAVALHAAVGDRTVSSGELDAPPTPPVAPNDLAGGRRPPDPWSLPGQAPPPGPPLQPDTHTTHISVVDREGNAVAMTTTINVPFGSCVVVPGTGILLNDEMDDFEPAPGVPNAYGLVGRGANAPAPGKTPLSSMAPTLVFGPDGRLWLAVGAPGGSTIPTTVAQVISHLVDDGMSLSQSLGAPRIHHQWQPDAIQVEPGGLEEATARALEARGHRLRFAERPWGNAQAVRVTPEGWREAASDPRVQGEPAAP